MSEISRDKLLEMQSYALQAFDEASNADKACTKILDVILERPGATDGLSEEDLETIKSMIASRHTPNLQKEMLETSLEQRKLALMAAEVVFSSAQALNNIEEPSTAEKPIKPHF